MTTTPDPLAPCGYCRRCAIHDDPGGCLTVDRYVRHLEGEAVATLLAPLPEGTEFRLAGVSSAYAATYRKNAEGLWDQVRAPCAPLVLNMDAAHLGFCVGREAIETALRPVFPAGGSAVGEKNLSVGQPGRSAIVGAAIAERS